MNIVATTDHIGGGSHVRHLVCGEYPPQFGGVAAYSALVAEGLAATGEDVHVWCPPAKGHRPKLDGVTTHTDGGAFSPLGLAKIGRRLNEFQPPRRLLVQWVPHAFGCRSMNLPLAAWLWSRAAVYGDQVDFMFHEAMLPFAGSWRQRAAACVHRLMVSCSLRAANRVYVSTPAWSEYLAPWSPRGGKCFEWLPVPSNIPVIHAPDEVLAVRRRVSNLPLVVGHFGTYGCLVGDPLFEITRSLLRDHDESSLLLLGSNGEKFRERLLGCSPTWAHRIHATGVMDDRELSLHLSACDVMLQPYPDGITTRRTSAMSALVHGLPLVSTDGRLTEEFWRESRGVRLAPSGDSAAFVAAALELLNDQSKRAAVAAAARALYDERFDLRHTIAALRSGHEREAAMAIEPTCGSLHANGPPMTESYSRVQTNRTRPMTRANPARRAP